MERIRKNNANGLKKFIRLGVGRGNVTFKISKEKSDRNFWATCWTICMGEGISTSGESLHKNLSAQRQPLNPLTAMDVVVA